MNNFNNSDISDIENINNNFDKNESKESRTYPKTAHFTKTQWAFFDENSLNYSDWIRKIVDSSINLKKKNIDAVKVLHDKEVECGIK